MSKPNVLLITVDCLRSDMLGCYGNQGDLTPALDSLATAGLHFTQAITSGGWTQAAFPAILTSSLPSMYGGCLGRLAPERPSPVEALAAQGYTTGGFTTNTYVSRLTGYDRGFQHFVELVPEETEPVLRHLRGGQRLLRSPLAHHASRLIGRHWRPSRLYGSATELTDSLCSWLDNVEQPFFAWAHYMDVHWPYHLEETLQRPAEVARAWQDLSVMHRTRRLSRERSMTAAEQERFYLLYNQALRYLDAEIDRLLQYIESSAWGPETIVVVTADHGEEFLEHGEWGHSGVNLFDETIRVPLIIRIPGQKGSTVIDRQVRLLDLMPSILDLCDCPPPQEVEGRSMISLWSGDGVHYEAPESISEMPRTYRHRIAVRTEAFKYIWDSKHPDQPELYDLRADPSEQLNVREDHPREAARFQATVEAHLRRMAETDSAASLELEFDGETLRRLRDLGYIE